MTHDPPSLGEEHGALGQDVGIHMGVTHAGDDLALGNVHHLLQR